MHSFYNLGGPTYPYRHIAKGPRCCLIVQNITMEACIYWNQSVIHPSIFIWRGVLVYALVMRLTKVVKEGRHGAIQCIKLSQVVFMSYYKLWPIYTHKQLNECINIDDMLQANGRNIWPPQAIGPFLSLPTPVSSEMHMYGAKMEGEGTEAVSSESQIYDLDN